MSYYRSSDYAGIDTDHFKAYYGYEIEIDEKWCFEAKFDGRVITIPYDRISDDQWDCEKNLMAGLSYLFKTYKLIERDESL